MSLLSRYLFRQGLFLLALFIAFGLGSYLLVDMFYRLPEFLEAGAKSGEVLLYFAAKLPLLLSQLLAAVLLLSLVVLLGMMKRNRELMALEAGGVSGSRLVAVLLCLGFGVSLAQFGLSQIVGVRSEAEANRIWNSVVRKEDPERLKLKNVWFRDGDMIIFLNDFNLAANEGGPAILYVTDPATATLRTVTRAEKVKVAGEEWTFFNVVQTSLSTLEVARFERQSRIISQDMESLAAAARKGDDGTSFDPVTLPVWELYEVIRQLKLTGSNTERLETSLHSKFSYALSMTLLALVALSVVRGTGNIYLAVLLALGVVFFFYAATVSGSSAAQSGVIPPWLGGWGNNLVLLFVLACRNGGRFLRR